MNLKKLVTYLLIAFLIFFVVTAPAGAADIVRSATRGLGQLADGLSSFIKSL